jgi:hypothetical protein
MKDSSDKKTGDLLAVKTKAQRFREKQLAAGMRQFSFWLTEEEAAKVKQFIESIRGA